MVLFMSIFRIYNLFLIILLALTESSIAQKYCDQYFPLTLPTNTTQGLLPVCANYSIDNKNNVQKLIVYIHGIGSNAPRVYQDMIATTNLLSDQGASTLVVAPQFHETTTVDINAIPNLIYWRKFPYWGTTTEAILFNTLDSEIVISPYQVFDNLLEHLITVSPNLREIIIAGFSGGGQFVQRYIGVGKILEKYGVNNNLNYKFMVVSPSSYLYFSPERPTTNLTNSFGIPSAEFIAKCPAYNSYGTGLDDLNTIPYLRDQTNSEVINRYVNSRVLYLVGELDDNALDPSLDINCYATIQGESRLKRANYFLRHLSKTTDANTPNLHSLEIVPQAGHNSLQMIQSAIALRFLELETIIPPTPTPSNTDPVIIPTAKPNITEPDIQISRIQTLFKRLLKIAKIVRLQEPKKVRLVEILLKRIKSINVNDIQNYYVHLSPEAKSNLEKLIRLINKGIRQYDNNNYYNIDKIFKRAVRLAKSIKPKI
jgi:hypothetical protein